MRDLRLVHQVMIGGKALYPNANVEHCKEGWLVLVGQTPEGKNDGDHIWIGHVDHGWARTHSANAAYVRYWQPGDEDKPLGAGATLMQPRVREALEKRGELPRRES